MTGGEMTDPAERPRPPDEASDMQKGVGSAEGLSGRGEHVHLGEQLLFRDSELRRGPRGLEGA
jgi:hypothetical protein